LNDFGGVSLRSLFLKHVAQTSPFPPALEVSYAEGIYITDVYGKKYIDFISGISVCNVGHRHPKVVNAVKEQLDKYLHVMVYGEFVQAPQVKLAQKIASILPNPLESVYFVNSGAEACEGALKLAKRVTGRTEICCFENAYHGSTHGALSVMGNETFKQAYRPLLPAIRILSFNDYNEIEQITDKTAAVILETFQGEAGLRIPDFDWLRAIRKRCSEVGALLILDEIQTGFGRTGACFAFRHTGVVPDIVLMAKGMGGGIPIGAFAASKEHMSTFTNNPILGHITTFGGNALACAASLATLETILEEGLIEGVPSKEKLIRDLLVHPKIKEIKGKGLLLAACFDTNVIALKVMNACYEKGLITDWFLFCDNALRIAPPLTITNREIIEACIVFLEAVNSLE
jgi:acetylornithine/succinyldiaminopimelate/putrescine aminotransferase